MISGNLQLIVATYSAASPAVLFINTNAGCSLSCAQVGAPWLHLHCTTNGAFGRASTRLTPHHIALLLGAFVEDQPCGVTYAGNTSRDDCVMSILTELSGGTAR